MVSRKYLHADKNKISRIFGLIFRSERIGKLAFIRKIGLEAFKEENV